MTIPCPACGHGDQQVLSAAAHQDDGYHTSCRPGRPRPGTRDSPTATGYQNILYCAHRHPVQPMRTAGKAATRALSADPPQSLSVIGNAGQVSS
jgi:hypothetical protein